MSPCLRHHQPEAPKFLLSCLKKVTLQTSHWAHPSDQQPLGQKVSQTWGMLLEGIWVKTATLPWLLLQAMRGRDNWTSQGSQSIQGTRLSRGWFLNRGLDYITYLFLYLNYFTFIWSNCSFSTVYRESTDKLAAAIRYLKQAHVNAPTSNMSSASKHKDQVE